MRNSECGMRNKECRDSTAYRRAWINAALREWTMRMQKRDKYGITAAPAPMFGVWNKERRGCAA